LSTQLQWQRSEDGHGNPWLGVVVDPIRSLSLKDLVMESFRAFPPEYTPPDPNQCPDGTIILSDTQRLERWGACFNRYYRLKTTYHMSSESNKIVDRINKDFKWVDNLTSDEVNLERVGKARERFEEGGKDKGEEEMKDVKGEIEAREMKKECKGNVFGR